MKRLLSIILTISMFLCTAETISANDDVRVYLDNQELVFDQPPIIQDGRTLVPMRAIFEALGASVEWNGETRTIKASKGTNNIVIEIGNPTVYVNGELLTLDVPATILNDRTLVPLRFISESLDCYVDWVDFSRSAYITSKNAEEEYIVYRPVADEDGDGFFDEFPGVPAFYSPLISEYPNEPMPQGYDSYVYDYEAQLADANALTEYMEILESYNFFLDQQYAEETGEILFSYLNDYALVHISSNDEILRIMVAVATSDVSNFISYYSDYNEITDFASVVPQYSYIGRAQEGTYTTVYKYSYKNQSLDPASVYLAVLTDLGFEQIENETANGVSYVKDDLMVNVFADESTGVLSVTIDELVAISPTYDSGYSDVISDYYPNTGSAGYNTIGDVLVYDVEFPLHLYGQDSNHTYLGKLTTNKYDMDSISNEYGTYGSSYSQTSIFNKYSDFGSAYSQYSAFNKYATNPPKIVDNNGEFVAYLTDSTYEIYGVTYEELMVFLKKNYQ